MATRQLELLVRERCSSGAISTREALRLFDRLLAAEKPSPSIQPFNHLLAALVRAKPTSGIPCHTVFSLFNRLTRAQGVYLNDCTYGIVIDCCTRINRLGLAFAFLGRFLKEGWRANAVILNPLVKGLCWENRIGEAAAMVLDKMPKLGCAPDVISCSMIIKGLCSFDLVFTMAVFVFVWSGKTI